MFTGFQLTAATPFARQVRHSAELHFHACQPGVDPGARKFIQRERRLIGRGSGLVSRGGGQAIDHEIRTERLAFRPKTFERNSRGKLLVVRLQNEVGAGGLRLIREQGNLKIPVHLRSRDGRLGVEGWHAGRQLADELWHVRDVESALRVAEHQATLPPRDGSGGVQREASAQHDSAGGDRRLIPG